MIKLLKPVDPYYVVQPFGVKSKMYKTYHRGLDLRIWNVKERAVRACYGGVVHKVDLKGKGSYGIHVIIKHQLQGATYYSVYGHLEKTPLETGERIAAGEHVGKGGNTGYSTGPHLHYEVYLNSLPVNPRRYILN